MTDFNKYGIKNTNNVKRVLEILKENTGISCNENQKNKPKPIIFIYIILYLFI
jgi:hypothetical protein